MTYRLLIKPLAEIDLQDIYDWLEQKQIGLGDRFLTQVERSLDLVIDNPNKYQVRYRQKVRMAKVSRFHVCIHFTVEDESIFVHAVLHSGRDPKIWLKR